MAAVRDGVDPQSQAALAAVGSVHGRSVFNFCKTHRPTRRRRARARRRSIRPARTAVAGASAPTPAAPGTYIPVAGATSAAAEVVDPAGTYSLAGASAPTTRPGRHVQRRRRERADAGGGGHVYSGHGGDLRRGGEGRPCRHLSAGAGASAPTTDPAGTLQSRQPARARPRWRRRARIFLSRERLLRRRRWSILPALTVSRARARRLLRSPDIMFRQPARAARRRTVAGYYTPYAGATAEILAQAPVISGTVAGQTIAPLSRLTRRSPPSRSPIRTSTLQTVLRSS